MNSTILKNIFRELPKSQPRSRIMQAIVNANPNSTKLAARTKSNTYEDPMSQNDFAYGRSVGRTNIQDQLQDEREQAAELIKNTPASPNNPTNTNIPNASQPSGTAAPTPNASVDDKTGNNQNVFNSIAASLNNNPGYLMPTAIGQTIIAALLGRLLGGKTGMGLGAIMGLLASPLTASYLARNNYLSDIAKPFAETEKGWFSNSK